MEGATKEKKKKEYRKLFSKKNLLVPYIKCLTSTPSHWRKKIHLVALLLKQSRNPKFREKELHLCVQNKYLLQCCLLAERVTGTALRELENERETLTYIHI